MKALEAAVSLALLIAMLPLVHVPDSGGDRRAAQYAIAQDMFNTLYERHGSAMFQCLDPEGLQQDIGTMSQMSGTCVLYETPFCALEAGCSGKESETTAVDHDSITGNVRLSVKR